MTGTEKIQKLILNSPYEEPQRHHSRDSETRRFRVEESRRPASYVMAGPERDKGEDLGVRKRIELVNVIRKRVKKWREGGYVGTTSVSRRLLKYWHDPQEQSEKPFFFCQLEAIETLIWLTEAPEADKVGIDIKGDGGAFERWCCKMATGSGKTIVMAMIIAWQFINKVTYPRDKRFSKYALVVAPGLTVKERLQVLKPSHEQNYYEEFNIVPPSLMDKLRQGKLMIHNWHTLSWDTQEKLDKKVAKGSLSTVDRRKRIEISDEVYARRQVLTDMPEAKNLIVLNDEAHHAWRTNLKSTSKGGTRQVSKEKEEEATIWVGGLDKIHRKRNILKCFDLSATPFAPSGKQAAEEALFTWIVSDFGLDDAIESGLVKTPRVPTRDDSEASNALKEENISRLYHIYGDEKVKSDLNNKAAEDKPLPAFVRDAYHLLGANWQKTKEEWKKASQDLPPVMITIANVTKTAARIKHYFVSGEVGVEALCAEDKLLQIDSDVLKKVEAGTETGSRAEDLRKKVNTVGKLGEPGEQIQNVISVQMLSEGWDTRTVTHIMGLRAFSSQLLCEQVIGRGLRRVSYEVGKDGLFEPEYVEVFGVPFIFLPQEHNPNQDVSVSDPKRLVGPVKEKEQHEISWPNVLRIDPVPKSHLELDIEAAEPYEINPYERITEVEMQAVVEGKPHPEVRELIGLAHIAREKRLQTFVFQAACKVCDGVEEWPEWKNWKSSKEVFVAQLIELINQFVLAGKVKISGLEDRSYSIYDREFEVHIILNQKEITDHLLEQIKVKNTKKLVPIFDVEQPVGSTTKVRPWHSSRKRCQWVHKSHISHCIYDSGWEASEAFRLDHAEEVASFVKNDHLNFTISYKYRGTVHKYRPDFIVKLANGEHLVLEVKGQDRPKEKAKRDALKRWAAAINHDGSFGVWHCATSFHPNDLKGIFD